MNCQREKNNLFRNFTFLFRFPAQSTVSGVAFCDFLRFPALFVYPEFPLLYFDRHEFQKIPNYFPVFKFPQSLKHFFVCVVLRSLFSLPVQAIESYYSNRSFCLSKIAAPRSSAKMRLLFRILFPSQSKPLNMAKASATPAAVRPGRKKTGCN